MNHLLHFHYFTEQSREDLYCLLDEKEYRLFLDCDNLTPYKINFLPTEGYAVVVEDTVVSPEQLSEAQARETGHTALLKQWIRKYQPLYLLPFVRFHGSCDKSCFCFSRGGIHYLIMTRDVYESRDLSEIMVEGVSWIRSGRAQLINQVYLLTEDFSPEELQWIRAGLERRW